MGGNSAFAAPLCEVVFLHTSPLIEAVSDIRHSGSVDINFRIQENNLFAPRTVHPVAPPAPPPTQLPLSAIHFMQNGVSGNFSKNQGSVVELARQIRDQKVKPQELPPIRVWRDNEGKIWSLDHRRLAAMILSGKVQEAPVVWASRRDIYKDSFKLKNLDGGDRMLLYLGPKISLLITRPQAFAQKPGSLLNKLKALELGAELTNKLSHALAGLKIKDFVLTKNLPVFLTTLPASSFVQTRKVEAEGLKTEWVPTEILFSQSQLKDSDPDILSLAYKIKSEGIVSLPPLRIWQDAHQRIWTLDNATLAALRLADYQGRISTEVVKETDVFSTSQSAGESILVELTGSPLSLVVN